jgi:hypothetical protein
MKNEEKKEKLMNNEKWGYSFNGEPTQYTETHKEAYDACIKRCKDKWLLLATGVITSFQTFSPNLTKFWWNADGQLIDMITKYPTSCGPHY